MTPRAGVVPVLPAGLDTTAGKVTDPRKSLFRLTCGGKLCNMWYFLLQLVMQDTGEPTVQKHATARTETAAVTL